MGANNDEFSLPKTVVGVLLLIFGLACVALIVANLARDLSLWVFGQRVEAEVVELWAERTSDEDAEQHTFRYFVRYRFATPDGKVITGASGVNPVEWVGLGSAGRGSTGADYFDDSAVGPAAPVYQEGLHIPQEGMGGMQEGERISVVYFPLFPEHNRLDESRFVSLLACAYIPIVFLGVASLIFGWRLFRPALGHTREVLPIQTP
jgi:hypothetical protein